MQYEDFISQLKKANLHKIPGTSHKQNLRRALLAYQEHSLTNYFSMSLYKKIIPAGVSLALVLGFFFTQTHMFQPQTVSAEQLVNEAIEKVENPNSEESKLKLELLQKAKESQGLQYLGEVTLDGKKFHKISIDEKYTDLSIYLDADENSSEIKFEFATDGVLLHFPQLEIKDGKAQLIGEVSTTTKPGEVDASPYVKDNQLVDSGLQDEVIKKLIQYQNKLWFQEFSKVGLKPFNEEDIKFSLSPVELDPSEMVQTSPMVSEVEWEKFIEIIRPIAESSELLITGISHSVDENGAIKYGSLSLYALGEQQQNAEKANELLDVTLQKLTNSTDKNATEKVELLQKAKASNTLNYLGEYKGDIEDEGLDINHHHMSFTEENMTYLVMINTKNENDVHIMSFDKEGKIKTHLQ